MVYEERNTWATLIATVITVPIYIVIVLASADGGPLTEVDWVPIMLWTMGASIVGAIVISIVWGILAGMRDPSGVGAVRPARPRHLAVRRPARLRRCSSQRRWSRWCCR